MRSRVESFTLLEVLITVGILAAVSAIAFIIVNPNEMIRQGRDAKRLAELDSLDNAINLSQMDSSAMSLGTSKIVYISLPDTSSTCASWASLPALPTGYTYHCVSSTVLGKTDGTGWIPLNLQGLSTGSPIASAPTDPVNDALHFYSYITSGTGAWEFGSVMESAKYKMGGPNDKTSTDGGGNLSLYERGTNLSLMPIDYGDPSLVGWWRMDETSGSTASDASGYNGAGSCTGSPTWVAGKCGSALSLSGSGQYVTVTDTTNSEYDIQGDITLAAWIKTTSAAVPQVVLSKDNTGTSRSYNLQTTSGQPKFFLSTSGSTACGTATGGTPKNDGLWHYIMGVRSGTAMTIYVDGVSAGTGTCTGNLFVSNINVLIGATSGGGNAFTGQIDDVRIYNRALSASEIQAAYNAMK